MTDTTRGHDAPSEPQGKATVPASDSFAALVRNCEAHFASNRSPVAMIGNDNLRDLLTCIREQQAALKACESVLQSQEALKTGKIGMRVTFECAEKARAVLAKWEVK